MITFGGWILIFFCYFHHPNNFCDISKNTPKSCGIELSNSVEVPPIALWLFSLGDSLIEVFDKNACLLSTRARFLDHICSHLPKPFWAILHWDEPRVEEQGSPLTWLAQWQCSVWNCHSITCHRMSLGGVSRCHMQGQRPLKEKERWDWLRRV